MEYDRILLDNAVFLAEKLDEVAFDQALLILQADNSLTRDRYRAIKVGT